MQRQMLRLTLILGVLVTMLGSTGVFAVFSDTARGGANSVDSGVRPSAANLMIATATESTGVTCGTFADNLTTAQFTATGLQPNSAPLTSAMCLRNSGAGALSIRVGATGTIRNADTACTGDEAAAGDATCGNGGVGELSPLLDLDVVEISCANSSTIATHSSGLDGLQDAQLPVRDSVVAAGAQICVRFVLTYDRQASESEIQIAQSDLVTWTFTFEGTAS